MTKRQEAFYYLSKAWTFAYTAVNKGYKYKRSLTCIGVVLDTLSMKLTNHQKKVVMDRIHNELSTGKISVFDFMDWIDDAMGIIKNGKERWLNSCLALAVTNIPEEIEEV